MCWWHPDECFFDDLDQFLKNLLICNFVYYWNKRKLEKLCKSVYSYWVEFILTINSYGPILWILDFLRNNKLISIEFINFLDLLIGNHKAEVIFVLGKELLVSQIIGYSQEEGIAVKFDSLLAVSECELFAEGIFFLLMGVLLELERILDLGIERS